eukprot:TRINITY_DN4352_c0_g1_i2.p1 TRINITY_DN4352_c0_g1~~TRINITY_DN4352_c0_g1_i2.p1  ORF type:complete len:130 (-),score=29.09 TRINITY_DN4352_c0_g1_i2:224-613(-)
MLGKMSGKRVWTGPDGRKYEGEWKDGRFEFFPYPSILWSFVCRHPLLKLYSACLGSLTSLMLGKMIRKDILTLPDGSKYEGEWKDGKRNGKGMRTWLSGQKYEGEWKDGAMNGKGVYTWPDGRKNGKGV